eukprot:1116895-Rhodomonas_salina.3
MDGPFHYSDCNEIWRVFASQMIKGYEELADVDMLEPDPPNSSAAMQNVRLLPFWMQSENKERDRLNSKGCFKPWKRQDLPPNNSVFGSRFHYHIKCDAKTGQITNCKVLLVVMGHKRLHQCLRSRAPFYFGTSHHLARCCPQP